MESLFKLIASATLAYTAHYGVGKLYNTLCIPDGFWGYMQGFVTSGSPMCSMLFTFMDNTQTTYSAIVAVSLSRFVVDQIPLGGIKKQ